MEGQFDAVVVGGGVGGAYAAWRLMTGDVSPGSPIPQDPTERRIALVEWSDRIGGRLESLLPPGIENLRAEFGGMGYTSKDKLVNALVSYFDLEPVDFPHGGLSNLFYLRGERFTVKDASDPSFTPPYQLEAADKGIDPRKLDPERHREGLSRAARTGHRSSGSRRPRRGTTVATSTISASGTSSR